MTPNAAVQDGEGGRTLFIDCAVYSRNRAFRLFLSSKAGKTAVLQPTGAAAPLALSSSCRKSIRRHNAHGPADRWLFVVHVLQAGIRGHS